jgi:hypothetical protein
VRRRLAAALTIAVAVALLGGVPAGGQVAATCTTPLLQGLIPHPPTFGVRGMTFVTSVAPAAGVDPARLTNVEVILAGGVVTPLTPTGSGSTVTLNAPAGGTKFDLTYRWFQDIGTATACFGQLEYTIPLEPVGATIGDAGAPRLSGTMHVLFEAPTGHAPAARAVWTLRPMCDVFGCATRVRSGALSVIARPRPDGYSIVTRTHFVPGTSACRGATTIILTVVTTTASDLVRGVSGSSTTTGCAHRTTHRTQVNALRLDL